MKKLLTLAAVMLTSLCINAQALIGKVADFGQLQRKTPVGIQLHPNDRFNPATIGMNNARMAKIEGESGNTRLVGLYTTDECPSGSNDGFSLAQYVETPSDVLVGSIIPADRYSKMQNPSIKAVRFGLAQACTVKNVIIYFSTSRGLELAKEIALTNTNATKGWNKVELDEPLAIPSNCNGILLCYEYTQTASNYPIAAITMPNETGFLAYLNGQSGEAFYILTQDYALCLQAYVECDKLPEEDIVMGNFELSNNIFPSGSELMYAYSIYNFGTKAAETYEVEVSIDGEKVQTITEKDQAVTTDKADYIGKLTLPTDIKRGTHTITAKLTKINGKTPTEYTNDDMVSATFSTYMASDEVKRQKHLIEEFTSHTCTYCPLGAEVIKKMQEKSNDLAVACIHGNQSAKDPFNTTECEALMRMMSVNSFPSAAFNRLYWGPTDGLATGIGYNANVQDQAAQALLDDMKKYSIPSFASINIAKKLDGDNLTITVSGKGGEAAKEMLKDYCLTVYILEDGLVYRQLNNGKWINDYVHNHVLRDVVTPIDAKTGTYGEELNWLTDSEYKNEMTVALNSDWVKDNLSIVAFISVKQPASTNADITNLSVSNAEVLHFTDKGEGGDGGNTSTHEPFITGGLTVSACDNQNQLMGEGMSSDGKYVVGLDNSGFSLFIWNTQDNTITRFPDYEEGFLHDVSLNGTAVGRTYGENGRAILCYPDGTSSFLRDNGGTKTTCSEAWAISEDGNTVAGCYYFFDTEGQDPVYLQFPCVWQDKKCVTLSYPSDEELGFHTSGAQVRAMNADGSVLLGFLIDDMATWPAIIWTKNEQGEYQYNFIAKDFFELEYGSGKPYMSFSMADSRNAISYNGEWVSLNVGKEYPYGGDMPANDVARLNLKTMQLEVLPSTEELRLSASGIADDGSMLTYTYTDSFFGREGYLWPAGTDKPESIDTMIKNIIGAPSLASNSPVAFTKDAKTIMGFGLTEKYGIFTYLLDLDHYRTGVKPITIGDNAGTRIFNLAGQQLKDANGHGLYIIGGKKILK